MKTIYFDNGATSFPKAPGVAGAVSSYIDNTGASPGRSAHRLSIEAGRIMNETREGAAKLLGAKDPFCVVFTANATEGLNIAIQGLLGGGGHVIVSPLEHNSVMRPLRAIPAIDISVCPAGRDGVPTADEVKRLLRSDTKAVIITHASNVTGDILPIDDIGTVVKDHGAFFCVDAAQSAGIVPINVTDMNIDVLAFTGHKALYGPQGTGGLYVAPGLEEKIPPLIRGGTGSESEYEEQPLFMPDKYESGTPNVAGIAGLLAGIDFVLSTGTDAIHARETELVSRFIDQCNEIEGVHIYGGGSFRGRTGIVSFNIKGMTSSETAYRLEERSGICCRPGLHCAPAAHRYLGTYPEGTVRFGFGFFNTDDEIDTAVRIIRELAVSSNRKGE